MLKTFDISIHAPHTGRDLNRNFRKAGGSQFQSTRPIRGATFTKSCYNNGYSDFNPRAPYGARRCSTPATWALYHFNPRAPYGARHEYNKTAKGAPLFQSTRPIRGATDTDRADGYRGGFQSTRPIRGATSLWAITGDPTVISIHAPHTGRDVRAAPDDAPV